MFYFYRIDFSILQPISRIAELLLFILTALVNNFYLTIHYICTWLHFHIIYEGVSKSKVKARRMSGMFWTTRHTLPAPYQVISICSDPWRSTWPVSYLQSTATCSALWFPGSSRFTPITSTRGQGPWCHGGTNKWTCVENVWKSDVYQNCVSSHMHLCENKVFHIDMLVALFFETPS